MGVNQAVPVKPKIQTDVVTNTTKVYTFDNWNDTDKLLIEGRQLLHDIEKEPEDNRYYAMCPECGVVFKKEFEVISSWIKVTRSIQHMSYCIIR